jgi:hypothetical protein
MPEHIPTHAWLLLANEASLQKLALCERSEQRSLRHCHRLTPWNLQPGGISDPRSRSGVRREIACRQFLFPAHPSGTAIAFGNLQRNGQRCRQISSEDPAPGKGAAGWRTARFDVMTMAQPRGARA